MSMQGARACFSTAIPVTVDLCLSPGVWAGFLPAPSVTASMSYDKCSRTLADSAYLPKVVVIMSQSVPLRGSLWFPTALLISLISI